MKLPLALDFVDLPPMPSVEAEIRQHMADLERMAAVPIQCRVTLASEACAASGGCAYRITIDLQAPEAGFLAREHAQHHNVTTAVDNSFQRLRSRLQSQLQRRTSALPGCGCAS